MNFPIITDGSIIELKEATYKVTYHSGPLSCSVANGMTLLVTKEDDTQEYLYLPPGHFLQEIFKKQNIKKQVSYEEKLNELKLVGYDILILRNNIIQYKCSNPACDVVNYGESFSTASYALYGKPNGGCRVCKSPINITILYGTN